jgi:hypothetical protein
LGKGSFQTAKWRPPLEQVAAVEQVAVAQQVGERRVGLDPHGEAAQHVGTVGEEGDGPEAFGLALGAEPAAGHVEAHQGLVGRRIDLDLGGQDEGVRDLVDRQALGVEAVLVGAQRLAVDGRRDQLQPLAVQEQRLARSSPLRLIARVALTRVALGSSWNSRRWSRSGTGTGDSPPAGRAGACLCA